MGCLALECHPHQYLHCIGARDSKGSSWTSERLRGSPTPMPQYENSTGTVTSDNGRIKILIWAPIQSATLSTAAVRPVAGPLTDEHPGHHLNHVENFWLAGHCPTERNRPSSSSKQGLKGTGHGGEYGKCNTTDIADYPSKDVQDLKEIILERCDLIAGPVLAHWVSKLTRHLLSSAKFI